MSAPRAAGLVAVALVATALTGCQLTSVKDEKVSLDAPTNAFVVSGGTSRPAADGDTVAKGDEVRTGPGGTVTLVVRDRRVVLGGDTSVRVPDGATLDLAGGSVLVDRRRGPGLTLRAGDTTVDNVGRGAVRVERSYSVLVAGLSARARVRTATGPRRYVDPLFQVLVSGRALQRAASPLHLHHDAWERAVIADVLTDDDYLNDIAEGLRGPGAEAIPAAYRSGGGSASDLVLAEAIGRAAERDEAARPAAVGNARRLRSIGGSWGVVARIVGTNAVDVASILSDVLGGVPTPADIPNVSAGPTGGTVAGPSPQPGVQPTPSPGQPTRSPGTTTSPTSRPPTTSPPTTNDPDPVGELFSLIPTPLVPDLGL